MFSIMGLTHYFCIWSWSCFKNRLLIIKSPTQTRTHDEYMTSLVSLCYSLFFPINWQTIDLTQFHQLIVIMFQIYFVQFASRCRCQKFVVSLGNAMISCIKQTNNPWYPFLPYSLFSQLCSYKHTTNLLRST
jgi:hypothetical protein